VAELVTVNKGAIVMENAYHGISEAIDALSSYDLAAAAAAVRAHVDCARP
jgi:hypothetical protein